jgi:hypothetical protein
MSGRVGTKGGKRGATGIRIFDDPGPDLVVDPKMSNLAVLEAVCESQATQPEIAALFRVSLHTVERWFQRKAIRDAADRGYLRGRLGLRRAQFKAALAGNATMMIWLGKQLLGQKDIVNQEHSGSIGFTDDARRQLLEKLGCSDASTQPSDPAENLRIN